MLLEWKFLKTEVLHLVWTGEKGGFYVAFGGLEWTGENDAKKASVDETF